MSAEKMAQGDLGCFLVTAAAVLSLAYAVVPPGKTACLGGMELVEEQFAIEVNQSNCGQLFTTEYWNQAPYVLFSKAKNGGRYTLFMLNLDDPKTPIRVYFLNWLVTNIPGYDLQKGNVTVNGDVLASYIPPKVQDWKIHRFGFAIFEQQNPNIRVTSSPITAVRRQFFNVDTWISTRQTPFIGPVAGIEIRVRQSAPTLTP